MEYSTKESKDTLFIFITGDFTFQSYYKWQEVKGEALAVNSARIVVNLDDVDKLDSAGLGMLLTMQAEQVNRNATMFLKRPNNRFVKTLLEQAKFDTIISFCDD